MRECNKCGHRNCGCSYLEKTGKTVDDREYTPEGYLIMKPFEISPNSEAAKHFKPATNWQALAEEMANALECMHFYYSMNNRDKYDKSENVIFRAAEKALDKFNKAKGE